MKATHILSRASNSARSSPRCLRLAQPTPNSPVRPSTLSPFSPQKRTLYNATTHSASTHPALAISSLQRRHPQTRPISTTQRSLKGLQPDSDDPAPPNTEPSTSSTAGPTAASISDAEYHEIADQYLDTLVYAAEELSESSENGIDVEYSAGVLTIIHPTQGSYVINKQPPNKQIWLSSPVSGPKRYDWVVAGRDAAQHEKEGSVLLDDAEAAGDDGEGGKWIYIRDGSGLSDLLKNEIGVVVKKQPDGN